MLHIKLGVAIDKRLSLAIFRIKFGFDWPSGFRDDGGRRRATDGRTTMTDGRGCLPIL